MLQKQMGHILQHVNMVEQQKHEQYERVAFQKAF